MQVIEHHDTHDYHQDHQDYHRHDDHDDQGVKMDQSVMRGNERMVEHYDRGHTHTSQFEV